MSGVKQDSPFNAGIPVITDIDPWLKPYRHDIDTRMAAYRKTRDALTDCGRLSLPEAANGYLYFGIHRTDAGYIYREWAPAAQSISLVGDFNGWDGSGYEMTKKDGGIWELEVTSAKADTLAHLSRIKARVVCNGSARDRIPLFIRKVFRDPETGDFSGQVWDPPEPYAWSDGDLPGRVSPKQEGQFPHALCSPDAPASYVENPQV